MIPSDVEIYIALEPIDMRLSFDRLSGLANEHIGYDTRSGALFVFFGRRKDVMNVLFFDGIGRVIFYKPLDFGRFQVHADVRHVEVDDARGPFRRHRRRPGFEGGVAPKDALIASRTRGALEMRAVRMYVSTTTIA